MLFFNSILGDLFALLLTILVLLYGYCKWSYKYWSKKKVFTLEPSVPFGNASGVFMGNQSFPDLFYKTYNQIRQKGLQYGGAYFLTKKFFVPTDPELIKNILQKDFGHFVNHGLYVNEETDPLSADLFGLEDDQWKNLRQKLTPTFTSGKMKMMFQTLTDCAVNLKKVIGKSAGQPIDIKEVLGCFSTDIIGSCAFGIDCNSLEDPSNEFRRYGKMAVEQDFFQALKSLAAFMFSRHFLKKMKLVVTKPEVTKFFMDMVRKTVEYREKNNIYRKDFMHLLIQLKNMGKITDEEAISEGGKLGEVGLTMNQITAQAFVFFIGGFETSSTTMTFALYELALNPQIQSKLREEVRNVLKKHDNKLTYEAVMDMKYMDQVIYETLRKYPAVGVLFRRCNKDYTVPNTQVTIEEENIVTISTLGIHYDHEYYPNPVVFDPDRFTEENKASRPSYTWLPFGEGPRICIGMRFGLMQSKVGLATVLNNFSVFLNRKTSTPLEFDKNSFLLTPEEGVWLDIQPLK